MWSRRAILAIGASVATRATADSGTTLIVCNSAKHRQVAGDQPRPFQGHPTGTADGSVTPVKGGVKPIQHLYYTIDYKYCQSLYSLKERGVSSLFYKKWHVMTAINAMDQTRQRRMMTEVTSVSSRLRRRMMTARSGVGGKRHRQMMTARAEATPADDDSRSSAWCRSQAVPV
jgi:hypothetical protein